MSADLLAGLALGAGLTVLVFVKLAAWGLCAAGRLLLRWISGAL